MTPLQQRIVDHLFETGRALSLSAITAALREPLAEIDCALRGLRLDKQIVLNGHGKYRLENSVKTRMGALQRLIDANVQLKAKPEGLERLQREIEDGLRALRQEQTEEQGDGLPEPTDAELDAIEGGTYCGECDAYLPDDDGPGICSKTGDETGRNTPVSRADGEGGPCRIFSGPAIILDPQLRSALRDYLEARNRLTELEIGVTDQKKLLADIEGRLRGMV